MLTALSKKLNEDNISLIVTIISNSNTKDDDYLMVNFNPSKTPFVLRTGLDMLLVTCSIL